RVSLGLVGATVGVMLLPYLVIPFSATMTRGGFPWLPLTNPSAPLTDLEYAIPLIVTGRKDPAFAARVQAETETITGRIHRKHGVLNIAIDLIREDRDEAGNPCWIAISR